MEENNPQTSSYKADSKNHKKKSPKVIHTIVLVVILALGGTTLALVNFSPSLIGGPSFTIGSLFSISYNGERNDEDSASQSPGTSDQVNTAIPSTGSGSLSIGSCLTGETLTPCDTLHDREVIGLEGGCTLELAYDYVEGNPDYDFFAPEVNAESMGDLCILRTPTRDSSVAGAWSDTTGHLDSLRLCFAGEQASELYVNCSENHVGEIVHQQSSQDNSQLNCESRAEKYTGQKRKFWQNDLKVSQQKNDGKLYCVLETRASKFLKTQLRDIRNSKVEIG